MLNFRSRYPLWNVQFDETNKDPYNKLSEMGLKHGDHSHRDIYVKDEENDYEIESYYSNRVNSLHRNSAFKSNDYLISRYEARVGGLGVRTLGQNSNLGKV